MNTREPNAILGILIDVDVEVAVKALVSPRHAQELDRIKYLPSLMLLFQLKIHFPNFINYSSVNAWLGVSWPTHCFPRKLRFTYTRIN